MRRGCEKGFALIITLLISAVLVAVIAEVVYEVHVHTVSAGEYKDGQRAHLLADGGLELAVKGIRQMTGGDDYTSFTPEDAVVVYSEGDSTITIRVEDEGAKIPVNRIVYPNGEANDEIYEEYSRLLEGLDLAGGLDETLADWIDANDEPRPRGAENADHYGHRTGYLTKGRPLDSLDEILLVKGYTPEAYGALAPFVTPYTDGRVNINTAPRQVLRALSHEITDEMALDAIERRKAEPFRNTAEIRKVQGFDTAGFGIQDRITVRSDIFRVFVTARAGGARRDIEAVVDLRGGARVLYRRER